MARTGKRGPQLDEERENDAQANREDPPCSGGAAVLFGVSPADPIGLGGAALLVLGVALAASAIAARPATRADPTAALRCE